MLLLLPRLLKEIDSEQSKRLKRKDYKKKMKPKKKRKSVFVKKSLQYLEPPRMKSRKQKKEKIDKLKAEGKWKTKQQIE